MSKRDEYVAKMKQQLDDMNKQIDKLEARSADASASMRAKYDEQVKELKKLYAKSQEKLEAMKGASESKWDELVAEGEKVQKAFVHSVNYFKSQLK